MLEQLQTLLWRSIVLKSDPDVRGARLKIVLRYLRLGPVGLLSFDQLEVLLFVLQNSVLKLLLLGAQACHLVP